MVGILSLLAKRNPIQGVIPSGFYTANDFASELAYTQPYLYGGNLGFFPGSGFDDTEIAELNVQAGNGSIRPFLGDWIITGYSPTFRVPFFETYTDTLGLQQLTCVLGEPNTPGLNGGNPAAPNHKLTVTFPGVGAAAKVFANLYEPIWDDPDTRNTVNTDNFFANYVKQVVDNYGEFIAIYCIVNEPDFTFSTTEAEQPNSDGTWRLNIPPASQLDNLNAPIFYYIRMLRIAWEVIKQFQPTAFVTGGGFGYPYFIKNVCELSDNPGDTDTTTDTNLWGSGTSIKGSGTPGSTTAIDFPLQGGAYLDIICYHTYPFYKLNVWDDGCSCFVQHRYSDWALDKHLEYEQNFNEILQDHGYDGDMYPRKKYIVTETDMLQESVAGEWGSEDSANNYLTKVHVYAQIPQTGTYRTLQLYKYGIAEGADSNPYFNVCGLYGDLVTGGPYTPATAPKNSQYWTNLTETQLLSGSPYNSTRTAALSLPSDIRGAAFLNAGTGKYTYVLWAVTTTNESEVAADTFDFTVVGGFTGDVAQTDYSDTGILVPVISPVVALTGFPQYFIES